MFPNFIVYQLHTAEELSAMYMAIVPDLAIPCIIKFDSLNQMKTKYS